jgi:CBS domain-containing protein
MVEEVKIKDIRMLITLHPAFVDKKASADDIAKTMIANPKLKSVCVVNDKLKLIGIITLKKLIKHEFMNLLPSEFENLDALEFIGNNIAEDFMFPPVFVKNEDTLKTAFVKMYENNIDELPVVDEELHLIGIIDMLELLTILIEKKEQKAGQNFLSLNINRPFTRKND